MPRARIISAAAAAAASMSRGCRGELTRVRPAIWETDAVISGPAFLMRLSYPMEHPFPSFVNAFIF
jgi:hypothetical protein